MAASNTCFSTPSTCPVACSTYPWSNTFANNFGVDAHYPSTFGAQTFGANPWNNTFNTFGAHFPTTFGANPWTNTFDARFPSTFDARFPSTFGAHFPTTFGANPWTNAVNTFGAHFPTTFGAEFPSTFDARFPSTHVAAEKSWSRHALPCEYRDVPARPLSVAEYWSLQNPIFVHPIDGSRLLHVTFDVKGFKPEEVKVECNAKERSITVDCKTDCKVEKEHEVKRSYTRKFVLPECHSVDLSKCEIKCHVTADGLLIVESALPRLSVEELKNLKEKVPTTKSTPFVAGQHYSCGPVVSIPLKTVA